MTSPIYKIVPAALWREAQATGSFSGAPVDHADGYIHFSAQDQVADTATRHFAGQDDLLLVAVEPQRLGDALRWETSRGGALFPHLYAPLAIAEVLWARPLPRDAAGRHDVSGLL